MEQFQPIDHRSRGRHRSSEGKVIVGTRTLSIPTEIWVLLGSPVYMSKARHAPTGELHFWPSSKEDSLARKVSFSLSGGRGQRVRLAMSAREQMVLKPGMYPAEAAEVLGRPTVIVTGALHEQGTGSKHGQ